MLSAITKIDEPFLPAHRDASEIIIVATADLRTKIPHDLLPLAAMGPGAWSMIKTGYHQVRYFVRNCPVAELRRLVFGNTRIETDQRMLAWTKLSRRAPGQIKLDPGSRKPGAIAGFGFIEPVLHFPDDLFFEFLIHA